jgi:hypothetical protein
MDFLKMLSGNVDYIGLVKEHIDKIFVHEAKKYQCSKDDLNIVISSESDGSMLIMTHSKSANKIWRIIPDQEVQAILMK